MIYLFERKRQRERQKRDWQRERIYLTWGWIPQLQDHDLSQNQELAAQPTEPPSAPWLALNLKVSVQSSIQRMSKKRGRKYTIVAIFFIKYKR